jgi:hypothetical protein
MTKAVLVSTVNENVAPAKPANGSNCELIAGRIALRDVHSQAGASVGRPWLCCVLSLPRKQHDYDFVGCQCAGEKVARSKAAEGTAK